MGRDGAIATQLSPDELQDVLEAASPSAEGETTRGALVERALQGGPPLTAGEWHDALWQLIMLRAEGEVQVRELQHGRKEEQAGGEARSKQKLIQYEKAIFNYVERIRDLLQHAPIQNEEAQGACARLLKEMESKVVTTYK